MLLGSILATPKGYGYGNTKLKSHYENQEVAIKCF